MKENDIYKLYKKLSRIIKITESYFLMENNMNYSISVNEPDDSQSLTLSSSAADVKKKRGRKKKNAESDETDILTNQLTISIDETNSIEQPAIVTPKKRGRKPKGGKLILKPEELTDQTKQITNIIVLAVVQLVTLFHWCKM